MLIPEASEQVPLLFTDSHDNLSFVLPSLWQAEGQQIFAEVALDASLWVDTAARFINLVREVLIIELD